MNFSTELEQRAGRKIAARGEGLVRLGRAALRLLMLATIAGCSADTVDVDGLPCGDEPCLDGYSCHPETDLCVPTVVVGCGGGDTLCPSSVSTGDACPSAGSFVPCIDGVTDCTQGCRTCQEDLTWGDCSLVPCSACGGTCSTFYADTDSDGLGNPSAPTQGCTAPAGTVDNSNDCDDAVRTCTTDCTTDVDQDTVVDCADTCIDGDGDGYGSAGGAGNTCTGADCNDGDDQCNTDCSGACSSSGPTDLVITVTGGATVSARATVDLTIALPGAIQDESGSIVCSVSRQTLWGPVDFNAASDLAGAGVTVDFGGFQGTADSAPFDVSECTGQDKFAFLNGRQQGSTLSNASALNLTGIGDVQVSFVAATVSAGGNDLFEPGACCGAACQPSTDTFGPAAFSGTSACSTLTANLQGNCADYVVELTWLRGDDIAGIDDIELTGASIVGAITRDTDTSYTTSFVAGPVGSVDVTCDWNGGTHSDTVAVTIQ